MILLRHDCLVFKMVNDDNLPYPIENVTVEVLGEAVKLMDQELIQHAAEAVLHFFKFEQERQTVTLGEFAQALEKVLRDLGLRVRTEKPAAAPRIQETDLGRLAAESGEGFELAFFARLRETLRGQLEGSPEVLRFGGLRGCVKHLMGARRWGSRCQALNDQIIDYLRTCLSTDIKGASCALVVR
jgi:hypothetical protein